MTHYRPNGEPETKEQFEARMHAAHGYTFGRGGQFVAMECNCDPRLPCPHWATIRNDYDAMAEHLEREKERQK